MILWSISKTEQNKYYDHRRGIYCDSTLKQFKTAPAIAFEE